MTKAVRVHKVGGPEALVYESVEVPAPGPGEVRIRQHVAWVGDSAQQGLAEALTRWFGPPAAA